jgi:transposase
MRERMEYLYVGVDPHKQQHTAVALNFFREKVCEITFANRPAAFPKVVKEIRNSASEGNYKAIVFGLEDTANYGRKLAVYLKEQNFTVKEVSSKLSSAKRKSHNTVKKSDSWDALCIATVLMEEYERLTEANPIDHEWAVKQLVSRRTASMKGLAFSLRKLHAQLGHHYPTYKKFFSELDGKTALGFFHRFPSPCHLEGVSLED